MNNVPNTLSIFIGIIVTILLGTTAYLVAHALMGLVLSSTVFPETILKWFLWTKILVGIIAVWAVIVFIGIGGFQKVLAAHTAVLIVLEYRFKTLRFNEGLHWVPPFISELRAFSTQNVSLPFAEKEEYVEMPSKDLAPMKVRGFIQYMVVDPYLASSVGDVTTTLRGHALTRLRNAVSGEEALRLPGVKEQISNTVRNGDLRDPSNIPDITQSLEIDAAKLGTEIIAVNISDMDPPEELILAKQREIREEVEKRFKRVESDGFAERVLAFKKTFPGLSDQEALIAIELQDGDKRASRVTVGSGGPSTGSGSNNVAPVVVINPGN